MKIFLFFFFLFSLNLNARVSDESELSLAATNGNTKTQSYNFKQMNTYENGPESYIFKGRFLNAFAGSNETARYLNLGLRYEHAFTDHFNSYVGEILERDKFAGYNVRHITDLGGKYFLVKEEKNIWFTELGYRYMIEHRYDLSTVKSSYIRAYSEYERKYNEQFAFKYWLELLPNLTNSTDYQMNTEVSVWAMMNKIFSLKSGFLLRYDHLPAPGINYTTDTLLTTGLVAKF